MTDPVENVRLVCEDAHVVEWPLNLRPRPKECPVKIDAHTRCCRSFLEGVLVSEDDHDALDQVCEFCDSTVTNRFGDDVQGCEGHLAHFRVCGECWNRRALAWGDFRSAIIALRDRLGEGWIVRRLTEILQAHTASAEAGSVESPADGSIWPDKG